MISRFKKSLRHLSTNAENVLWRYLKNRNMNGHKFRRQHVLQSYVVDFICLERKLIIELDGSQHVEQVAKDIVRTQQLEKEGFQVMRFWNHDVLKNTDIVLEVIYAALQNSKARIK